jgi:hypothetical protein
MQVPTDPEESHFKITEEFYKTEELPLTDVTVASGEEDWPTRRPNTYHSLLAEKFLIEEMARRSTWNVHNAWMASLIPEMQVIYSMKERKYYLFLYVCPRKAVLACEVSKLAGGYVKLPELSAGGSFKEQWLFIYDLDAWEVFPSAPASPLCRGTGGLTGKASKETGAGGVPKQGQGAGINL